MIIILNRKKSIPQPFYLYTFMFLLLCSSLFALKVNAAPEDQKVYDNYGLFSSEEITKLEDICNKYGEEGKVDIVILTTDDLEGKTYTKYMEDFNDEMEFGYDKESGDAAIILISMEPDNHFVGIQGYGNAEYYLNNDRTEHVLDDVTPLLQDGNFYDAMETYAKEVAYYMNEKEGVDSSNPVDSKDSGSNYGESSYNGPSNYYGEKDDNLLYNSFVQLGIALLIGAGVVLAMVLNSGGRVTVHNRTYLDEQNSGIVANHDNYVRTTTTRVKKPTNNNNDGGRSSGGGGVSSGGNSHSGGGRSF
jgi:uncharacterized protein